MSIKAYLFTNMARQINHTYYSLENNKFLYFYYNLIDNYYGVNRIIISPFVYEVEIKPETILECEKLGLTATEFKIVREVEFVELVNAYKFSTVTKNEINSILNGTAEPRKVVALYKRAIQKSKWNLSRAEQFKFLAILNQNHYELPTITISEWSEIPYARLLKHFNKKYIGAFIDSSKVDKLKREKFYGDINFEYGIDLPMKELICHINLKDFIVTRRLSQKQFEEYCEFMSTEERIIFHTSYAIAAGYKILPKYKKHFYPYLIYSDPELALEVFNKDSFSITEFNYFYEKNYKITGNYNYSNERVKQNKEIFVKEVEYKYI